MIMTRRKALAPVYFILKNHNNLMSIKCPLDNSTDIKLERSIKTALIIDKWQKDDIDVVRFFTGLDEICLYHCLECGYKGLSPIKPPQAAKKAAARPQVMHI